MLSSSQREKSIDICTIVSKISRMERKEVISVEKGGEDNGGRFVREIRVGPQMRCPSESFYFFYFFLSFSRERGEEGRLSGAEEIVSGEED